MFYKWLILLFFLPNVLFSQEVSSPLFYNQNRLWGLGTQTKPITPAVYDTLISINNSKYFIAGKHKASTTINTKGVLSEKGKVVIPHEYLNIDPVTEALIVSQWVNGQKRVGVLSFSNEVILPIRFKAVRLINEFWIATSQTDELKLYSKNGEAVCGINADSVSVTNSPKFFHTYKNGKVGLLSTNGKEITPPEFFSIAQTNGEWVGTHFPKWQLIQNSDTLNIYADSIQIWNDNTLIKGYGEFYFLEKDNKRISLSYESIRPSKYNLAITKKEGKFGAISIKGRTILPNKYQSLYIENGYLYTKKEQKWNLFDSLGVKKSVFTYDSIGLVSEGLFPIKRKGKWGFMNRHGIEVIHCIYDTPSSFSNGKAIISYFGKKGIINNKGNWEVKPIYDEIIDYTFGSFYARLGNQFYHKNYDGGIIYFSSDSIPIFKQTLTGPEANTNESVTQAIYEESWKIIHINGKYGFEGKDGLLKITYRYDSLLPFSEGLAAFKLRGKWGFIDRNEQIIIQPLFSQVTQFNNGASLAKQGNKYGLIDSEGNFIVKPNYDGLESIAENIWLASKRGKKGLYDQTGSVILHPIFNTIDYVNNELIIVSKEGKYGIVNSQGHSITPRVYDYIGYNSAHQTLLLKKNPEKPVHIK